MPVLVDGYNLLRAVQKSDEDFQQLNEVGLCRILSEYFRRVRTHGHVVFDGTGPFDKTDMERLAGFDNLEVYFSGPNLDADEVIEEKIQDNTAPKSLVVVSTDRELRTAALKRKAVSIRSEIFWLNLIQHLDRKQKPSLEPRAKREGITEAETDQWLEYFNAD